MARRSLELGAGAAITFVGGAGLVSFERGWFWAAAVFVLLAAGLAALVWVAVG